MENHKRELQKRVTKETYKKNLQKKLQKTLTYKSKETYNRDPKKTRMYN